LLRLKATLERERERERVGPSSQGARVAGRIARERINADIDVDEQPVMTRASHKLVMAATMIRAMPEPSTPEGRNLRREAQILIEQAAVQQAESSERVCDNCPPRKWVGVSAARRHRSTLRIGCPLSTRGTRGPHEGPDQGHAWCAG
jgi:hypothetical protein